MADLVKQLFERYQVRVVGFDVAFSEADTSSGLPVLESLAERRIARTTRSTRRSSRRRALRSTTTSSSPTRSRKWPVVLGIALRRQGGPIAGVLPPPNFVLKALGDVRVPLFPRTGYSGNISAPAGSRMAARPHLPRARHRTASRAACRCSCSYDDALLRVAVAGDRPHLSRQRPDQGRRSTRRLRRAAARGLDALRARSATVCDPARPRDDGAGPLPRRRRLPLRLGDRRDPRHARAPTSSRTRSSSSAPRPRGLLDLRATPVREDLPGRGDPRQPGGRHARQRDQEPPAGDPRHHRAAHPALVGVPLRAPPAAAVRAVGRRSSSARSSR